ncbi:hypothetical protein DFH28DRAFT_977745 [Melampsora americana]|nr:hypothetical protein DFH28DRAFT_977745 [Melampsora americana]
MTNQNPSLVTLADRILIPAVSLTELPDLTIEPLKVQELILDYISEQDCPGALAHLQRELGRSNRRPQNHSASRLVQLVAKGLLYEKNTPRLDSILQGCNSIMRSLENESQANHTTVVSSGLEDKQQSTSHPKLNSHPQARHPSESQPQHRNPNFCHTQPALHYHEAHSSEPNRGRTDQCSSKLQQPSFPQGAVANVLLPPFSASTRGPDAGSSSMSTSELLVGQNYHDHLIQSTANRDFGSHSRTSASLGDAPHSFMHFTAPPTPGPPACSLNSNTQSIITAQPLDKDSRSSTLLSKSQLNLGGSPSPRHAFMTHENTTNQAQANAHVLLPSADPLDPSTPHSDPRGRWHTIGDTDEIMCLDTDGCPAPELISAPVSPADHFQRNDLPDVKPNLPQRYGPKSPVPDSTFTHLSPERSSIKRSRATPTAQASPPIKRPRKAPSNPASPNRSLLTSPTNVMLYDLSDADLPGTPPEVSPHISWQSIPDLPNGDITAQNDDLDTETKFMEPEPPRDLSDVGTPRGSPSSMADLNIPTEAPVASPSKILTPPVMITEDHSDSALDETPAELPSSALSEQQAHTSTTARDSEPNILNQGSTSTLQALEPNLVAQSSTPPCGASMLDELRAKVLASRKPRPPVIPIAPVAPVPSSVLGLPVPSAEPPKLPSLSLEQNLKAHLKSRRGVSPVSQSQAGATEELEDGQISTPPPEENPNQSRLVPPIIKHPLPLKPDFLSSSSNYQPKTNSNSAACFLAPSSVPFPSDGGLSHPKWACDATTVNHIPLLRTNTPQNQQELQDLKERHANLMARLAQDRAKVASREMQESTSRQGSLEKTGVPTPPLSSTHLSRQNPPRSPVFDCAKRHDRPSALDTFNLSETALGSTISVCSTNSTQTVECLVNVPVPRQADEFLTSLQEQIDTTVMQPDSIHSTSLLKSVSKDSVRSSLSHAVHQESHPQKSESGPETLQPNSTHLQITTSSSNHPTRHLASIKNTWNLDRSYEVEVQASSPSESSVSSAESSVEIFLADNPEGIVSIDTAAPDSGPYFRDERSAQFGEYASMIPSLLKGSSDHSVCKCKDPNCIVGHCGAAARHGASPASYRASDARDAPCPKVHSRVPTPAPTSTTNQSNTFWNTQLCRYDMQCLRQDCHFRHTKQKQLSTSSKASVSLPKRSSEGETTSHSSKISTSTAITVPHSTYEGEIIRRASIQSLRHEPSPAPDKPQEFTGSISPPIPSYSSRETRPPALQVTLNGSLTSQPLPTSGSPVIENTYASHPHSSTPSGPWSVADQLEQYANPARGLRDWTRQSDDSILHMSPRISSPMPLPEHNVPLSSSMNNFSLIYPPYSPQCFELARPVPLPPRPSHSAFLSFDDADATSLPTVPLASSTSGLLPHPSSSTFPQLLTSDPPTQPIVPATLHDNHKRSDPHLTRSLPAGPSSRPIPSIANPARDERRTKSGKPRNPSNPNNLLVPPILNDLLLGVKKVGQQQVQSDLDLMNRRDPGGERSEQIGK